MTEWHAKRKGTEKPGIAEVVGTATNDEAGQATKKLISKRPRNSKKEGKA